MIVVDACLVLGLAAALPYSEQATARVRLLKEEREELYAPALLDCEVCSALRRAVARGIVDDEMALSALTLIDDLRIRLIAAASSLHSRALLWATRLDQSKACDAHYLASAEQMQFPLLTADERLVRSARALGADWVRGLD